ncbi:hypothetical protein TST_1206 [Thermosulfidibacter takaii ABI70S6]|uniref:Uncharacterized protein n=1 Tax=Thermosulfidibacter takaii (strain DSM 17441 / JCM 13301 / NBRC 103674 / ABI70S6) TaxID=1298851 RepID=A0A0S3QUI3_THET7|nr:hypothetical protein [Thermosulfidibacter takaii]BAT71997.1 hypothetical protein TST_1206 [Thermosulfidibacter takaii ABI70S6]
MFEGWKIYTSGYMKEGGGPLQLDFETSLLKRVEFVAVIPVNKSQCFAYWNVGQEGKARLQLFVEDELVKDFDVELSSTCCYIPLEASFKKVYVELILPGGRSLRSNTITCP